MGAPSRTTAGGRWGRLRAARRRGRRTGWRTRGRARRAETARAPMALPSSVMAGMEKSAPRGEAHVHQVSEPLGEDSLRGKTTRGTRSPRAPRSMTFRIIPTIGGQTSGLRRVVGRAGGWADPRSVGLTLGRSGGQLAVRAVERSGRRSGGWVGRSVSARGWPRATTWTHAEGDTKRCAGDRSTDRRLRWSAPSSAE